MFDLFWHLCFPLNRSRSIIFVSNGKWEVLTSLILIRSVFVRFLLTLNQKLKERTWSSWDLLPCQWSRITNMFLIQTFSFPVLRFLELGNFTAYILPRPEGNFRQCIQRIGNKACSIYLTKSILGLDIENVSGYVGWENIWTYSSSCRGTFYNVPCDDDAFRETIKF